MCPFKHYASNTRVATQYRVAFTPAHHPAVHAPSEHTLNGVYYDAEVHIVHKDASGNLAVIGVFLDSTSNTANAALQTMLGNTESTTKCTEDASSYCPGALRSFL